MRKPCIVREQRNMVQQWYITIVIANIFILHGEFWLSHQYILLNIDICHLKRFPMKEIGYYICSPVGVNYYNFVCYAFKNQYISLYLANAIFILNNTWGKSLWLFLYFVLRRREHNRIKFPCYIIGFIKKCERVHRAIVPYLIKLDMQSSIY